MGESIVVHEIVSKAQDVGEIVEPKKRPIIFDATSVRAILEGTKTQTRRVMNPQPTFHPNSGLSWRGGAFGIRVDGTPHVGELVKKCPLGRVGERLWVRETYGTVKGNGVRLVYKADGPVKDRFYGNEIAMTWGSPIYMPRKWSRITLEISNVRVERIQDISVEDVRTEGLKVSADGYSLHAVGDVYAGPKMAFAYRWDMINVKRGYGWESNPWVWAITFRRLT